MWIDTTTSPPAIIKSPRRVTRGDTHHPPALFTLWTDAERAVIGIIATSYADSAPTRVHVATGETVDGGLVKRSWQAPPLEDVRNVALGTIDRVRIARGQDIAAGGGSEPAKLSLYQTKVNWAFNLSVLGNTLYNAMLAPEAIARGITVEQLAAAIMAKHDAAMTPITLIEAAYATASIAIKAATTAEQIVAFEDAGIAAIEAIE